MGKNVSQIVKKLARPLFSEQIKAGNNSTKAPYIWEGIYQHYRDVPVVGEGFGADAWANDTLAHTEWFLAETRVNKSIPTVVAGEQVLLPLLVSTIRKNSDRVKVLDFGGGLGVSYICLKAALGNSDSVDYIVIETRKLCGIGTRIFEQDPHINFYSELPPQVLDVDILYICSALQYVEDYESLLNRLCEYDPQYVLLVKTAAGDIPTFATAQMNVTGSIIPFWFINIDELTELLGRAGYRLVFKGVLEREYSQENLPESHRLKHACNLLFSRNS